MAVVDVSGFLIAQIQVIFQSVGVQKNLMTNITDEERAKSIFLNHAELMAIAKKIDVTDEQLLAIERMLNKKDGEALLEIIEEINSDDNSLEIHIGD